MQTMTLHFAGKSIIIIYTIMRDDVFTIARTSDMQPKGGKKMGNAMPFRMPLMFRNRARAHTQPSANIEKDTELRRRAQPKHS